jgi:uncharacterized protein YqjF (DUF2071 family)
MSPTEPFKQIFWQTWRDLVFIHWEVSPDLIKSLLPHELEPDLFDGRAYVGLVPFRMTDIRSVWLPPIPGTSRTLETNVRTYVKLHGRASEPIPAVWFFSLEAESALAVAIARLRYGLPYFKATMQYEVTHAASSQSIYKASSCRLWPKPTPARSLVTASFEADSPFSTAIPGTLEHFLVERYALYARKRARLTYARVSHAPYQIKPGVIQQIDSDLLRAAEISTVTSGATPLVHLAQDVVVRIGAPRVL